MIVGTAETRFVKYRSKENDFKILSAIITDVENPKHERLLGKTVTFQGRIEEDDVAQFKFSGKVTINEKYGGQIRLILAYPDVDINSRESLLNFLKRYVTSLQFDELCNTFEDPIEPLWNGNKEELMKVKGIGPVRVLKLIERFEKVKDDVEFIRAYTALDIDPNVSDKLLDAFQGNLSYLLEAIKQNVYQLQYIAPRLSFKECDRIYLSNGGKEDDEIRIIEVAENSFNQIKNEGDTVTQKYEVVGHANDLVENPDRVITKALEEHPDRFVRHDDGRYSSFRWFAEELMVALKLTEMLNSENNISVKDYEHIIKQEEEINGFAYTQDQLNAVDLMLKNQVVMLEGGGGSGKAQDVNLTIPTPNGRKRFGDLKEGDLVFDRLGKPTKVVAIHPQGLMDNYEVTLSDGRKTTSNDEHLWSYYTSKGNLQTKTLREMIDSDIKRSNGQGSKYKIPVAKSVDYPSQKLAVHPYVLGALIGDGCNTVTATTISSDDEFVVNKVADLMGGVTPKKSSDKNFNWTFELDEPEHVERRATNVSIKKHGDDYRQMVEITRLQNKEFLESVPEIVGLANQKSIPERYLHASKEQRMELVQGMMDTDGSIVYNKGRYNTTYSTTSKQLSEDFRYLLASLGYMTNVYVDERIKGDRHSICYCIKINIPNSEKEKLFTLPRRKAIALECKNKSQHRDYTKVSIIKVEKLESKVEMMCIEVDNDEHLYLTNDFIVTHNTASVKLLCRILTENQYTFAQCALAGKASNNMANATGCPASTIHRLLAYSGTWGYNKDNPLSQDVIIVDEISMVDVELFSALVQAIKNGNKIVVIGDLGQLEPIGIQVMRPLIESNLIPTYTYTQIHRQAAKSTIITDSMKIRNGINPLGNIYKTGKTQEGELGDLMYFTTDDDSKVLSYSFAMFKRLIDSGEDISDIQVITQRKADCLTINVACQQYYQNGIKKKLSQNTVSKTFDSVEVTFHEGDKVINISNNYDTLSVDGLEIPVFNGSVGIIKNISADDDLIIDFEGIGEIIFTSVKSLELAYAVTVHKLQGSQVKNLIVALANVPRMLTRQLLYTAITRAQKACFVFSSYDAIKNSVNNNALMEKQTNLRNMLIDPNAYTRMALENTKRKTPQE